MTRNFALLRQRRRISYNLYLSHPAGAGGGSWESRKLLESESRWGLDGLAAPLPRELLRSGEDICS